MKKEKIQIKKQRKKNYALLIAAVSLTLSLAVFFFTKKILYSAIIFISLPILIFLYIFAKNKLDESARIKKMEEVFPDFIELMSSNLRAGMTTDKALLLSSRKEFSPLDKEILGLGKDIITGKEIDVALNSFAERINSEKIRKTVNLIVSGIKSGGNLATLLEETATSMREQAFVEKKASSNVLMYVIFIFFAVAIGAPTLFALSSILVEVFSKILVNIPSNSAVNLPFNLSKINISVAFINYFSILFIIVSDVLAALVLGLVNKGEEKSGLKYVIPLVSISMAVFFIVKLFLGRYFFTFFS